MMSMAAIEYFGVRRLYRVHPDYILLLSFGLSLILTESIILVWGPVGITFQPPALLTGAGLTSCASCVEWRKRVSLPP